jgi:hypothetical protein
VSKRLHRWRPGLLAALLALAAQVMVGGVAPDFANRATPSQQLAALMADPGTICRGDSGNGEQKQHRHGIDCAVCPYCVAITAAVVLRNDNPILPLPRGGPIAVGSFSVSVSLLPSRHLAARPRGPPVLS